MHAIDQPAANHNKIINTLQHSLTHIEKMNDDQDRDEDDKDNDDVKCKI